jgi:hypothetical protein
MPLQLVAMLVQVRSCRLARGFGGGIMPLYYTKIFGVVALVTVIALVLWQVWISVFEGQTFEEVTSHPPSPSTGQAAPSN